MVDVLTYDVELVELEAQPTAVVRGHASVEELPAFLGAAFADVMRLLSDQHLGPAGPPFGRYAPTDGGFDVEAGFPATRSVVAQGRVAAGELPGGPAARVLHRGGYEGVGAAYEAATEWLTEHGLAIAGQPWEFYLDAPGVADPRTLVHVPCRRT